LKMDSAAETRAGNLKLKMDAGVGAGTGMGNL